MRSDSHVTQIYRLLITDVIHITALPQEYGDVAGLAAYKLRECEREKTAKLSLSNPTLRSDEERVPNMIVDDPDDDMCTYKILRHWIQNGLPPGWTGLLFLNIATEKERKERPSPNDNWWGGTKMVRDTTIEAKRTYEKALAEGKSPSVPMRPSGALGKNWPNDNAKILFKRCGHPEWHRATARTGRRTGIFNVADAGVPQHMVNAFGRHKTDRASFRYQEFTTDSFAKALKANWYKGEKKAPSPNGKFGCCLIVASFCFSLKLLLNTFY